MSRFRGFVLPLALALIWESAAARFGVESDTLSKPSAIAAALLAGLDDGSLLAASLRTLAAAFAGFGLGAGLGGLAGLALGLAPPLSRAMRVTVEALRPIPAVAVLPIALLAFGFGYRMEIAIVAFACFFPVLILTEHAVGQIAPGLSEVAKVLRLSTAKRIASIVVPATLPTLFVALRLAAGIALIVAVTVEVTANPMGLGYRLMTAAQSLRPADMFATLVWVGLIGWTLNYALLALEARLFTPVGGARP